MMRRQQGRAHENMEMAPPRNNCLINEDGMNAYETIFGKIREGSTS